MSAGPILVTGAAGFIGFHVAKRLLENGHQVVGVDCLTPYYDVSLKQARQAQLKKHPHYISIDLDLCNFEAVSRLFADHAFKYVVHLAAQPGVRAALTQPKPYIDSNIVGFLSVLEACRHAGVAHLIYASSSSVYGLNGAQPFSEHHGTDHPISLYAATKKSNEMMAHSYAHLFGLPVTGLRFFTVYGPWGRPDMAVYSFTDSIAKDRQIEVANDGEVWRDFTYVDDVVEGIYRLLEVPPVAEKQWDPIKADPASSSAPYRIYNIGNDSPEKLDDLIRLIETALGKKSKRVAKTLPPGDVLSTRADITELSHMIGFKPSTSLSEGVSRFVEWYRIYHADMLAQLAQGEKS